MGRLAIVSFYRVCSPDVADVVVDSYANRQGLVPCNSALGEAVVKLAARLGGVEDPALLGQKPAS